MLVFLYQMPITSGANSPAAAIEKAQATRNRMFPPIEPATQAAISATPIRMTRAVIRRRLLSARGSIIRKYTSWLRALAMANRRPSAVDSAAARPPAATRPAIT